MSESKDRAALRALLFRALSGSETAPIDQKSLRLAMAWLLATAEADTARAILAKPDPAEQLAEALEAFIACGVGGSTDFFAQGRAHQKAVVALAAWKART